MVLDALTLQYLQTGGKRSKRERCRDEINRIIFAETPEGRKDPLMDEEQHELRRHCEQQQARTAKWSLTRFPTESHVVVELDNITQRWKRYTMRHELDRSGQDLCNDLIARAQDIYLRPPIMGDFVEDLRMAAALELEHIRANEDAVQHALLLCQKYRW